MVILFESGAAAADIQRVAGQLETYKLPFRRLISDDRTVFRLAADPVAEQVKVLAGFDGIDRLLDNHNEALLISRDLRTHPTTFDVNGVEIGGDNFTMVAGPCAVESEVQFDETAAFISELGIKFIRGGAYKPRTSPYSFQGLGTVGLEIMRKIADKYDLRIVTEILDTTLIDEVADYSDIFQVGTRNMQNYYLLRELGKTDKPVLLKRGMGALVKEWLLAAEYIVSGGNEKVILCERGIRTFETATRNTMDVNAIAKALQLTHLPVWADPSHATGERALVSPIALSAVAAGAGGLLLEIHPDPDHAFSDGEQALTFDQMRALIGRISTVREALGTNFVNN